MSSNVYKYVFLRRTTYKCVEQRLQVSGNDKKCRTAATGGLSNVFQQRALSVNREQHLQASGKVCWLRATSKNVEQQLQASSNVC